MVMEWFVDQEERYHSKSTLVIFQLFAWNRWQQKLEFLDMALFGYALFPFLIKDQWNLLENYLT
jgi:hypothetical protein